MRIMNSVLATLLTIGVIGIDFEIEYSPDSLSQNGWENEGTDSGNDMSNLKGSVNDINGINALCWDGSQDNQQNIDYINYNTNDGVNPELTMIVWIRPETGYTPQGMDWLMGHDNGGYDRSIIVFDGRYNGIAMGIGGTYQSTISYPTAGEWTSVTATFSKSATQAIIYKNGGNIAGGSEQARNIVGTSGGEPNIGLNGLKNYGNHNFVGCIGRVQIINQVLTPQQVADVFNAGILGDPCANVDCDDEYICEDGECKRDCQIFAIDEFLDECSTDWPLLNTEIDGIQSTLTSLQDQIDENVADIATNGGKITTNTGDIATNGNDIATNGNDIATNSGNIATNTGLINQLRTDVNSNDGDIASINTDINTLRTNLNQEIADLQTQLDKFKRKLRKKGAGGAAAMYGPDDINDDGTWNDEWNYNDNYDNMDKPYTVKTIWKSLTWEQIGMVFIGLLLMANIIFMSYNLCKKNKPKRRYQRVQYMDSDGIDSESNLKQNM